MPEYRKIFPSYCWKEDVWRVNQIVNLDHAVGKENIGFIKGVPNEEVQKSDAAIAAWIYENMQNCSCVIFLVGEETHLSRWVKYEIELANKLGKGRFIIHLKGMKNREGACCQGGVDPYDYHKLYTAKQGEGYIIKQYNWVEDKGLENIKDWIEEACQRAGK